MGIILQSSVCVPGAVPALGMLLATGGEFAFVAFGEAVGKGVLPVGLTNELYMVVALSMAMVPYLAALGGRLGVLFERSGKQQCQTFHLETLHHGLPLLRGVADACWCGMLNSQASAPAQVLHFLTCTVLLCD